MKNIYCIKKIVGHTKTTIYLKLSEIHLINKIIVDARFLEIRKMKISKENYKMLFN